MKILRKVGIALFSMMLFCSISVTAFASENIYARAHVEADNSTITVEMRSKDNRKHAFSFRLNYYDNWGRVIKKKLYDPSMTTNRKFTTTEIRDWEKIDVTIYCDGDVVYTKTLKRKGANLEDIHTFCYLNENDNIQLVMRFKDDEEHKYKREMRCFDSKGNEIKSDTRKEELTGGGECGVIWNTPSNWNTAKVVLYANDRVFTWNLKRVV